MALDPHSFLATVVGAAAASAASAPGGQPVRLATVDPAYTGTGPPRVTFDGEDSVSSKLYAFVNSYRPTAGDRVVLIPVGGTYVIAGKISSGTSVPVRSSNLSNKSVAATGQLVSTTGSTPRLTTTATDMPGAFWTFTTTNPNAVASVTGVFDVDSNNNAITVIGALSVDGVEQAAQALYRGTVRATVAQTWQPVLASPGTHTLKLTGRLTTQGDTITIHLQHTTLTATVYDL